MKAGDSSLCGLILKIRMVPGWGSTESNPELLRDHLARRAPMMPNLAFDS